MICAECRAAADVAATLPRQRNGADVTATNRYNGLKRRINNGHGRCRGRTWCDCQHRNTPHAIHPGNQTSARN